jgi:peptide/nickel transport system substrate-binding protein
MRALARLTLAGMACAFVIGLAASISITTATQVVPMQGGTYIEGLVGRPGVIHPLFAPANQCDSDLVALVYSGLTRRNDQGHIVPDLAERWDISPDARIYTFALRSNARWHDGAPVTANDVVYTVQALQGSDARIVPWLKELWKGVVAERVSDQVVRLTLPAPYAPFLQYTTLGLLPAHILAGRGDDAREAFEAHPVGSGPYRLRDLTRERAVLEAVREDRFPTPMIPRLEFRYYRDLPSALSALRRDEIMAVADIPLDQAESLAPSSSITLHWARRASQALILFNLSLPFFEDADVRRALFNAIDRPLLVQTALKDKAIASGGPFLTSSWASAGVSEPAGIAAARALLDKAGWTDTDGDGIRQHNGVKLEFGLLTNDDATRVMVAQDIARAWTSIGASVEVQIISSYGLIQDYMQPRRFEAVLFGWGSIADDPDPYEQWHSTQSGPNGLNFTGFASHALDEILEQARQTGDQAKRRELYARVQQILMDQLPALPLYEPMFAFAVSNKVQAVRLSYITEPGDRFRHLAEWYVMTRKITITEKQRVR